MHYPLMCTQHIVSSERLNANAQTQNSQYNPQQISFAMFILFVRNKYFFLGLSRDKASSSDICYCFV